MGERGWTQFHAAGCMRTRAIGNEGHGEALEWTEQSQERDYAEQKARGDFDATYDSHLAAPNPHADFNLGTGRSDG